MDGHKRPAPARSSSHRTFRPRLQPSPRASASPPHADSPSRRQQHPPPLDSAPATSASPPPQHTPKLRPPGGQHSPVVQGTPSSVGARRLSSSSTASRPTPGSLSSSGSYFGPLAASSSAEARSPAPRKPPASHSSHGIETSNGPPIALITRRRSNPSDAARRSQSPADVAREPQQLSPHTALSPSPRTTHHHTRNTSDITIRAHRAGWRESSRPRSLSSSRATSPSPHPRGRSSRSSDRGSAMASNSYSDSQSDYDFAYSHRGARNTGSRDSGRDAKGSSSEDLFLNIAQDSPQQHDGDDDTVKIERRRSRIARMARQSLPANSLTSPATRTAAGTGLKTPSAIDTKFQTHYRRASQLPSPAYNTPVSAREQAGVTASFPADGSRVRSFGMTPSTSAGLSKTREQDDRSQRRSSIPDGGRTTTTSRESRYRPSNLTYNSRYNQPTTPLENSPEITSKVDSQPHGDGSESLESTTAASTVWDELDELKSRIKKLELTGKLPPTSGAAVANGMAERPRTATTQATSVTASPKQQRIERKVSISPPETTVSGAMSGAAGASHPLLHSALAKCQDQVTPALYRVLEATATDALELAAMAGGAGQQSSAVSVGNGVQATERQLRRKADNMCRSLTDLCIALCDGTHNTKGVALKSPGLASQSRRQSVQMNGDRDRERERDRESDQPTPRGASVEPDGEVFARNSPSRALGRIEARRTSMLGGGSAGNSPREPPDRDRTTPTQQSGRNQQRTGSSLLNRPRRATVTNDDQPDQDEEGTTLRVPSRAMTDFAQNRQSHGHRSNRLSREYTSNVPLPDGASSVVLQRPSTGRRPNGVVPATESPNLPNSSSLLRDRRQFDRSTPPTYDSPRSAEVLNSEERRRRLGLAQNATPRTTTTTNAVGLSRASSLSRRLRQDT